MDVIRIKYDTMGKPIALADLVDYFNLIVAMSRSVELVCGSDTQDFMDIDLHDQELRVKALEFFMKNFLRFQYDWGRIRPRQRKSQLDLDVHHHTIANQMRRYISTRKAPRKGVDLSEYEILAISYTNPFWSDIGKKNKGGRYGIKPLVVAIAICGGEIEVNDNSVELPGLVDGVERVVRLAMDIDDHFTQLEDREKERNFLNDNAFFESKAKDALQKPPPKE